jgi:hypothetical protein
MSGENQPGLTVRPCEYCGKSVPDRRKDARYCSTSHRVMASRRRKRQAEIRESLVARGGQEFTDQSRPDHWDDSETEFSDEFDLLHEAQDDETGIVAGDRPDPWEERNAAWAARQAFGEAIDRIKAEYEHLEPYQQTLRRNQGVKPAAMVRIEQERDARIGELTRAHQLADALDQAERNRPYRQASAHERQVERAAARALAIDLGRGRHLRDEPADAGRDVHDAWIW